MQIHKTALSEIPEIVKKKEIDTGVKPDEPLNSLVY